MSFFHWFSGMSSSFSQIILLIAYIFLSLPSLSSLSIQKNHSCVRRSLPLKTCPPSQTLAFRAASHRIPLLIPEQAALLSWGPWCALCLSCSPRDLELHLGGCKAARINMFVSSRSRRAGPGWPVCVQGLSQTASWVPDLLDCCQPLSGRLVPHKSQGDLVTFSSCS